MSHLESVAESFWKIWHMRNEGQVRPILTKRVNNKKIVDALLNAADMLGEDKEALKVVLKLWLPKPATDLESISYFPDYNKYSLGLVKHRTKVYPGRFFLKLFPTAPNNLVEAFASYYQTQVIFDPSDYIIHIGDTKEDFKNAFTRYHKTRGNFDYNEAASISDSCMRYGFPGLSDHPSVVYASGDFKVITVRSKSGKTRARVVCGYKGGKYSSNRIYASCNHSKQLLLDKLKELKDNDFDWRGLKLLKINAFDNRTPAQKQYLCPYIDHYREVSVFGEDHLVIGGRDTASNWTGGYVTFY
jgi:hypothetical protein